MAEKQDEISAILEALKTETPRWCKGCGDNGIINALMRFIAQNKLDPANIVNISGIGCSGRAPHYINTYGINSIHGRPIPIATGLSLMRPDLNIFVHSGDGDALSIGGNHLLHGLNKNINCVFILYDNNLYALTKNQTSPTTKKGQTTNTSPHGTLLDPINPVMLALGLGGAFVARSADWFADHLVSTIEKAFQYKGFSFIHVLQRCTHFCPTNFDFKNQELFEFLTCEEGIPIEKRLSGKSKTLDHNFTDLNKAFELARSKGKIYMGLFYQNKTKPCYEDLVRGQASEIKQKDRTKILDYYAI